MANTVTIEAAARERAGKGAARATRAQGRVPAVIYGAKQAPALISLEPKDLTRELSRAGWQSRLYEITGIDGAATRALLRDVQYHPVTDKPLHVDFQRLAPGQEIRVSVPVHFDGEAVSPGLKRGGVLNVIRHTVEVFADPDRLPERFEADLSQLDINDNVRWHDLRGIEGLRPAILDRDFVVATVAPPTKMAEPAAEPAAAAAPAATAAPAKGGAAGKAAPAGKPVAAAKTAAKPAGKK